MLQGFSLFFFGWASLFLCFSPFAFVILKLLRLLCRVFSALGASLLGFVVLSRLNLALPFFCALIILSWLGYACLSGLWSQASQGLWGSAASSSAFLMTPCSSMEFLREGGPPGVGTLRLTPISPPPSRPLLRAFWFLSNGIWGLLKGSWGVLVLPSIPQGSLRPPFRSPRIPEVGSPIFGSNWLQFILIAEGPSTQHLKVLAPRTLTLHNSMWD